MGADMYCQTRLFNRNSTYYYRAKIPVDLQGHYGKTEHKFSLKTKDRAKAAALVRQFAARHEEEYARIRTKYHTPFQVITHIDDAFIQDIRARYRYAVFMDSGSW